MNYLEIARRHIHKTEANHLDQPEISELIKNSTGIIEKTTVIPPFEAENYAKSEESKRFCPVCRVGDCSGCEVDGALLWSRGGAGQVVKQIKQAWDCRVRELTGKGVPLDDAVKLATQEALASDSWRQGLSVIG